jgi:hypothetical protein
MLMSLISDHALRKQLLLVREQTERDVATLRAELTKKEEDLHALTQLIGGNGRVLLGDSLREEAHKLLKEIDPEQKGVHYQRITRELLDRGFTISGKSADKAPNVRSTIAHGPKANAMFRAVGSGQGTYTWI